MERSLGSRRKEDIRADSKIEVFVKSFGFSFEDSEKESLLNSDIEGFVFRFSSKLGLNEKLREFVLVSKNSGF